MEETNFFRREKLLDGGTRISSLAFFFLHDNLLCFSKLRVTTQVFVSQHFFKVNKSNFKEGSTRG